MSKASTAIYVLLAVACAALLFVWYALGFYLIDSPVDLLVAIVWWALVAVGLVVTIRADKRRKERLRTVYVGEGQLFNPEKGLVPMDGREVQDVTYALLKDLEYGFGHEDMPEEDEFAPSYMVRTSEFDPDDTWKGEVVKPNGDEALRWEFNDPQELGEILAAL